MVGLREGRIRHVPERGLGVSALLGVVLCLVAGGGESRARGDGVIGRRESAEPLMPVAPVAPIVVDEASEVPLAPPLRLPLLGPRYAKVTLDLFVAAGSRAGDINSGW